MQYDYTQKQKVFEPLSKKIHECEMFEGVQYQAAIVAVRKHNFG